MRVVFLGTPDPAAVALAALLDSAHEVLAGVTQPDRPRGRGRTLAPPPVKELAIDRGLPVLQPESPNRDGFPRTLEDLRPEAFAVVAYGHILSPEVLAVAPAVNVHFSLLPRYRGAAPVQRAIMDGETETGVTTFLLEPTVDTGPTLLQEGAGIGPEETAAQLLGRLAPIGARLLVASLDRLSAGDRSGMPQDPALASSAPKLKPEEARINWTQPAPRIANLVRALNDSPGAWTTFRGKRVNVWRARPEAAAGEPGALRVLGKEQFAIGAGDGSVIPVEIQPEGKRRMSGEEFARGYRLRDGERFE